jgi:hypothetical protein
LHQRVATARQIETYVFNPLGEFAQGRFDELWVADTTRSIGDYMRMLVEVRSSAGAGVTGRVGFVRHLDQVFIDATPFVGHLVKHGIGGLRARLPEAHGTPELALSQVDDDPADQVREMSRLFEAKYGDAPGLGVIVRLHPP